MLPGISSLPKFKDQADMHCPAIEDGNGFVYATLPLDVQHQRLAEGVANIIRNRSRAIEVPGLA
jgi:hypothetical protein